MLADQHDARVGPWQPEALGNDRGKCRAGIVVGAENCADLPAVGAGEDAVDLGIRIGGACARLFRSGDKLLNARAGTIVEAKVDARRGEPLQLAMIAMRGADHEHGALRRSGLACAPPLTRRMHFPGRIAGMGLCQQGRQSQIDRELRLRYCPRLGKDSPRSMPLHFGKIFAAIALSRSEPSSRGCCSRLCLRPSRPSRRSSRVGRSSSTRPCGRLGRRRARRGGRSDRARRF